jgi:hypothetical protein
MELMIDRSLARLSRKCVCGARCVRAWASTGLVLDEDARAGPTRADARLAADSVANGRIFAALGAVAARSERSVSDLACEAYCRGVTITVCGRITGDLDGAVRIPVAPRAARDLEFAGV